MNQTRSNTALANTAIAQMDTLTVSHAASCPIAALDCTAW